MSIVTAKQIVGMLVEITADLYQAKAALSDVRHSMFAALLAREELSDLAHEHDQALEIYDELVQQQNSAIALAEYNGYDVDDLMQRASIQRYQQELQTAYEKQESTPVRQEETTAAHRRAEGSHQGTNVRELVRP